ncbi:MAG TPA: hypothetical protein VF598_03580 [Hymenobacter sp.]
MKKSTTVLTSLLLLGSLAYLATQVLGLRLFFDLREEKNEIYH